MILHTLDTLYNMRQDGKLSDAELLTLLHQGHISQWAYERLLALKSDGTSDWSKGDPDENDNCKASNTCKA